MTDTPRVYRLHSTIEVPLDTVYEHFEDADLPDVIEDIEITRRNNTLIIDAVPTDDEISKYTPTAQLKATVSEKRVLEEEPTEPASSAGLQWKARDEDEEEPATMLVEYAGFKGTRETVLLNTELQYPMFEVLVDLAKRADRGTLTAITAVDGELVATRIVDGEECPATIEVVEEQRDEEEGTVNWRDNKFIS